jgi:hypothetical protein
MNNNSRVPNSNEQSPLSLLVNAAEGRDGSRGVEQNAAQNGQQLQRGSSLADTLRRGLGGDGGLSLEEQLMLQQQLQGSPYGGLPASQLGFLSSLREQNLFSQYGHHQAQQQQQQHQLAMLLGLGGQQAPDMHALLRQQQQQQQAQQQHPQLTQADILALSRSGALSGLSGILGGGLGGGNVMSELEGLQRLDELERRQCLLSATSNLAAVPPVPSAASVRSSEPEHPSPAHMSKKAESLRAAQQGASKSAAAMNNNREQAASSADVVNKEDIEKAPGSVIVPCRARGMPMDHNFKVNINTKRVCFCLVCGA